MLVLHHVNAHDIQHDTYEAHGAHKEALEGKYLEFFVFVVVVSSCGPSSM
jgi:hypothetical protein